MAPKLPCPDSPEALGLSHGPLRGQSPLSLDVELGSGLSPWCAIGDIDPRGKTTYTVRTVATVLDQGGVVASIDAEAALDPKYAELLGVQLSTTRTSD